MSSLRLTRADLEGIFGKGRFKEIKQFERLIALSDQYLDNGMIDGVAVDAGDALAGVNMLTALVEAINNRVDPPPPDLSAFEARLGGLEQAPQIGYAPASELSRAKLRFVS